ncbi:hypothetical protein BRADI_1g42035v3 [Brachypodium distachyon]|uniref:Uncharacterized protein n=1 Tax=Brachypodium distachyon TaxID=15368 RepID=A0A2K2DNU4_BRADI|nr:hypothetical protein BRADI_1g42035v3 [Brachypodium distachyon]
MPKEYMLAYCEPYLFCKLLLHKYQCSCTHYWTWDPGGYTIAVRLIIYADGTPLKIARSYYCQLVFESAREVQHECCQFFIAWYHTCRVELDVLYNYALYLANSAICRMLNLSMKEVGNLSSAEQLFRILARCIDYLLKRFSFCLHCAKEGWSLNWLWDSRAAVQLASQVMCYTRTEILEAAIYIWMDWQYVSLIDSGISLGTFRGHSIRFSYLSKALAAGLSFDLSKYGGVQGALVSKGHAKLVQLPWDPGIRSISKRC